LQNTNQEEKRRKRREKTEKEKKKKGESGFLLTLPFNTEKEGEKGRAPVRKNRREGTQNDFGIATLSHPGRRREGKKRAQNAAAGLWGEKKKKGRDKMRLSALRGGLRGRKKGGGGRGTKKKEKVTSPIILRQGGEIIRLHIQRCS